jgi:hypothetical protein
LLKETRCPVCHPVDVEAMVSQTQLRLERRKQSIITSQALQTPVFTGTIQYGGPASMGMKCYWKLRSHGAKNLCIEVPQVGRN